MHGQVGLISTIAVGLVYALIGGYFAKRIGMPPFVGYLLAGVVVGPYTPGFVADASLAPQLAEIGVVLLMFGVGMHFSIRDLLAVRNVAVPGAIIQIALAVALTCGVTHLWGWHIGPSLVFGLALSVASTVVVLRVFETRGKLDSESGRLAIGWLIVEDLLTVLILVLLPALAGSLHSLPVSMVSAGTAPDKGSILLSLAILLVKFLGFILFMLLIGARLLRWLLGHIASINSRELFTLTVIVTALGLGFGAAQLFGLSYALGAFVAGTVVGESGHNHRAATELQSMQDAFAALFFVAMGMLFDPAILIHSPISVLVVVAIIVVGKPIATFFTLRLFRQSVAMAFDIAPAFGQIGEFSFILAAVAVESRLMPVEGQSLIVAGALISIALNSFMIRVGEAVAARLTPPEQVKELKLAVGDH